MTTKKTLEQRTEVANLFSKMWEIFEEHGGYEYNDEMYWQLQGMHESISAYDDDQDIPILLKEAKETMAFFDWVVEYKELMDREPPTIYA